MRILFLISLQILFLSSAWGECTIKLRVNDSPPYYYLENNEYRGLFVDQARNLASQAGCQLTTIKAPWGRALRSLEDGKIDMMANMSYTKERAKFLWFLGPHHFEKIVLVVSENSDFNIHELGDLLKLPGKIAVEKDAFYGDEFGKLLQQEETKEKWVRFTGENLHSLNERVRLGRLSGYLDVAKPKFAEKGLKYHPFIINSSPVFFGLSKKSINSNLFQKLQSALKAASSQRNIRNMNNQ